MRLLLLALTLTLACSDEDGRGPDPVDAASGPDADADAGDPGDAGPPDALPPDRCPDPQTCGSLTYLGGAGPDAVTATAFGADGSLLVAGRLQVDPDPLAGAPEATSALGATTGILLKMDPGGLGVRAVFRMGEVIDDVDVQTLTGRIAIISDVGVAVLEADGTTVAWESDDVPPGSSLSPAASDGRRVSVGASDGVVAAANFGRVQIFEADGTLRGTMDPLDDVDSLNGGSRLEDVAVDSRTSRVVLVGWQQACPAQLTAFAVAQSYEAASFTAGVHDGAVAWRRYDWTCPQRELAGATGDSRLVRAVVRGGEVTVAGWSTGPSTFFRQPDPQSDPRDAAGNLQNDIYDTPSNLADNTTVAYLARFGTDDGAFAAGRFLIARTAADQAADIRPFGLDVAPGGDVILTGQTANAIANRDEVTIDGTAVGPYGGPEAFAATFGSDLSVRQRWEVYTAGDGGSVAGAAALAADRYAVGGTTGADLVLTDDALDADRDDDEGFLVAFPR